MLAGGACLFVGAIVVLADLDLLPTWLAAIQGFPGGDKLGHVLIYGALTAAVDGLPCPRGGRCRSGRLGLLASGIALEEISQAWVASRTFSLLDLACSATGLVLAIAWRRRARSRERPADRSPAS
ncbi:MAG: hypothetical protein AB7I32_15145 [Gammaproteobacteria bacterium]